MQAMHMHHRFACMRWPGLGGINTTPNPLLYLSAGYQVCMFIVLCASAGFGECELPAILLGPTAVQYTLAAQKPGLSCKRESMQEGRPDYELRGPPLPWLTAL